MLLHAHETPLSLVSGIVSGAILMYLCMKRKQFQEKIQTVATSEAPAGT